MRVAFVGTNDRRLDRYPPGGGIESQVWPLARHMASRGHDVHILTRFRGKPKESVAGVTIHGVPSDHLDPRVSSLLFSRRSRTKVEAIGPDLVYLSEKLTSYAVSRTQFPKVYYTHNKDTFQDYRRNVRVNPLKVAAARALEDRVMGRCDLIICPTVGYREELRDRGFDNTEVIPPGIELDAYADGGDQEFLFFSGQLHPVKGVKYLVEAFAFLQDGFPNFSLLVGGDGPRRRALEAMAAKLSPGGRIRFRPWSTREELLGDFARCSAYVLPSLSESFGIVTLEAMASGKPVVASDISGPRDILRHGVDGYLVPPGDSPALAVALEELMLDPALRRRMGASGRRRASEFHIRDICRRMESAMEKVVS
jgi:glycosyltransferase involved in cell wall biosynthesis